MFSPSAIADFLACQHLTALNRAFKAEEIKKPYFPDPGVELLRELGLRHEQEYLRRLTDELGLEVVTVPDGLSWSEAGDRTVEAMRAGAEAIYQASFLTGELNRREALLNSRATAPPQWYGRADFLLRVESPSELGSGRMKWWRRSWRDQQRRGR